MPVAEIAEKDLLERVKRMAPPEFDAFLEKALSARAGANPSTLSAKETKLIERINRGLPEDFNKRYARLDARRKKGKLTAAEHREMLEMTEQAEGRDVDRLAALVELSRLRKIPVRALMKQMGIKTPAIDG